MQKLKLRDYFPCWFVQLANVKEGTGIQVSLDGGLSCRLDCCLHPINSKGFTQYLYVPGFVLHVRGIIVNKTGMDLVVLELPFSFAGVNDRRTNE